MLLPWAKQYPGQGMLCSQQHGADPVVAHQPGPAAALGQLQSPLQSDDLHPAATSTENAQ